MAAQSRVGLPVGVDDTDSLSREAIMQVAGRATRVSLERRELTTGVDTQAPQLL